MVMQEKIQALDFSSIFMHACIRNLGSAFSLWGVFWKVLGHHTNLKSIWLKAYENKTSRSIFYDLFYLTSSTYNDKIPWWGLFVLIICKNEA